MENNEDYKCEECNSDTTEHQFGRFKAYFCPVCHADIDTEKFMAEHCVEQE